MSQLRQHEDELKQLGVEVLAITFERQWMAEAYARETRLPWPLLIDESRGLYHAYDMSQASWRDLWGLATLRSYAALLVRGRRIRRPTGDVTQRGGNVLVDPDGIVRLVHVGSGPADRPSVDVLLETVRQRKSSSS